MSMSVRWHSDKVWQSFFSHNLWSLFTLRGYFSSLKFIPVGTWHHVSWRRRPLQGLVGAPPVGAHRVVIPQSGRFRVTHPLGIAGVVTRLHQQGVRAVGLQVPVEEMWLVVLTVERQHRSITYSHEVYSVVKSTQNSHFSKIKKKKQLVKIMKVKVTHINSS